MGPAKSPFGGRFAFLGLALISVALLARGASGASRPGFPLGLTAARRAYAATRAAASGGELRTKDLLQARPLRAHPSATSEQLDSCTEQYFSSEIDHFTWCGARPQGGAGCRAPDVGGC